MGTVPTLRDRQDLQGVNETPAVNTPRAQPLTSNLETLDIRHCQELLHGVADTRNKLLDSYCFLVFILALLHFLTYIQFLCTFKKYKGTKSIYQNEYIAEKMVTVV